MKLLRLKDWKRGDSIEASVNKQGNLVLKKAKK